MFAELNNKETEDIVEIVLLILGLVACGVAVWRASLRDIVGTVLCAVLGLVLLLLAA